METRESDQCQPGGNMDLTVPDFESDAFRSQPERLSGSRAEELAVLYIAGYSRSGSTLLLRLLGETQGVVSVGELFDLWQRSFVENQLCGCGEPFQACEFWREVTIAAFGVSAESLSVDRLQHLRGKVHGYTSIPRHLAPRLQGPRFTRLLAEYQATLGQLYRGIATMAGANTIVDSSKVPQHAWLLNGANGIRVHVCHLVRDSRATAFSWRRAKVRPEIHWTEKRMDQHSTIRSAVEWMTFNSLFTTTRQRFESYTVVRYEDLVENPKNEVERLRQATGIDFRFRGDAGGAQLQVSHTASGNPSRFESGRVSIKADLEWVTTMGRIDRKVVTGLTYPLLAKYGYLAKRKMRDREHSALTRGTVALVTNGMLTSVLGVLYWLVAAHLFTQDDVGRGSALVSGLLTVAAVAQCNYNVSLSARLVRASNPRRLVTRVYRTTVAVGLFLGLTVALTLADAARPFEYLDHVPGLVAVFALCGGLWTVFAVEDTVLASSGRSHVVAIENTAFGVLKLASLLLLARLWHSPDAIFVSWIAPLPAVILGVNVYIFKRVLGSSAGDSPAPSPLPRPPWDYIGGLAWLSTSLLLPVIVTSIAGTKQEAVFYVAFTIALAADSISVNVGNMVTATVASGRALPADIGRFTSRYLCGVAVVSGVGVLAAPWILNVFGGDYRSQGVVITRIIMIAALSRAGLFLALAIARARGLTHLIFVGHGIAAIGTLGLGLPVLSATGIAGLAWVWLGSGSVAALAVGLTLLRDMRTTRRYNDRSPSGVPVDVGAIP